MNRFGNQMNHFAPRSGRGGGGGRGGRGGGYGGGRGGRGGGGSDGEALPVNEALTADTIGFFSDLDPYGKYKPQTAASFTPRFNTGSAAQPQVDNGEGLSEETAPNALGRRRVDARSGEQMQDSILWLELGLCKALIRAVAHLGFVAPTPVQTEAIPAIATGADCCVRAVTGSGKTAAFVLPMLHQLLTKSPIRQTSMGSKRRYIRAVILVPSRELGVQCHEMVKSLMQFTTEIRTTLAIGGIASSAQEAALEQAPDIVIATPGRLIDILHNYKGPYGAIDLSGVEMVVLDECDKMLTITLKDQVVDIVDRIPAETRQMLLFSATMTSEVDEFAKEYLFDPKNVDIGHVALASQLRQQFVRIKIDNLILPAIKAVHHEGEIDNDEDDSAAQRKKKAAKKRRGGNDEENRMDSESDDDETKEKKKRVRSKRARDESKEGNEAEEERQKEDEQLFGPSIQEHVTKVKTRYLVALCEKYFKKAVLVFTKYRTTAHRLQKVFALLGLRSAELQGNQLQEERFESLRQFASGEVQYLFCTDVASRGLDIKGVNTVINFDLPPTLTAYIHRVGRTARIGDSGTAVALVHETMDADIMRKILTVSGNINQHQVASVKRRDIPEEALNEAMMKVNEVFPRVREILAAENLVDKISMAEKKLSRERTDPRATFSLGEAITSKPKRTWCLSKKERKERDALARKKYEEEAEVTITEAQQELADLDKDQGRFLQKQKTTRRQLREKKQREREKELDKIKEQKMKFAKKVQAGNVKKLKKQKIRESRKAQRAENREKKGRPAFKHTDGKKHNKKSRHRNKPKKH